MAEAEDGLSKENLGKAFQLYWVDGDEVDRDTLAEIRHHLSMMKTIVIKQKSLTQDRSAFTVESLSDSIGPESRELCWQGN
jgi:hypothetical protein